MPIYEYHCTACDHSFEEWQKMSDPAVEKCPKCGKKKVEKLISSTAFVLQGTGWYATDYGGKKANLPPGEKALKADKERSEKKDKTQKAAKDKSDKSSAPAVSAKKT